MDLEFEPNKEENFMICENNSRIQNYKKGFDKYINILRDNRGNRVDVPGYDLLCWRFEV